MTPTTDQAQFTQDLQGLTCDGYLLKCNFARLPLAILKRTDLSHGAVRVYALLLWYLHRGASYPGHAAASEEFGIPVRTLKRHLAELIAHAVIYRRRHGRGHPNSYHFPDPRLPGTQPEEGPDVAHQEPQPHMMGQISSHDGPDSATRGATSGPLDVKSTSRNTEESFLGPLDDNRTPEQKAAADAALDKVRAQHTARQEPTP